MILIPAIDLRRGRVVRLRQGKDGSETSYHDSPLEAARRWASEGAPLLHVVDLDAAFGEAPQRRLIAEIVETSGVPVQVGGGVRRLEDFVQLHELGAAGVIFGTVAVETPEVVERAMERAADKVIVGVDVKKGFVAIRGWTEDAREEPEGFGRRWRERGVERFIYTDVARDGELTGVNVDATASFARATGGGVVASGGIGSLLHLRALNGIAGLSGVIAGKALYENAFRLGEGQAALDGGDAHA